MNAREIFNIWAPHGALWTDWAKPVLFTQLDKANPGGFVSLEIPCIPYAAELQKNTAVIIDLPDYRAVNEGLALAELGFRPVPLYNLSLGQQNAMCLLQNGNIQLALTQGAELLKKISIPQHAPPAFLLDENRTRSYKMNVSVFDNSYDIYGQDLPSAEYFLKHGISTILLRAKKLQRDLKPILQTLQKNGLKIVTAGSEPLT